MSENRYTRTYYECLNCGHDWVEFVAPDPRSCVVCGFADLRKEVLF